MRSLNADKPVPTLIVLLSAITLLGAWMAWFLLARITIYESSQTAQVIRGGMIIAEFPPEASGHIQRGQLALLRLNGTTEEYATTIPAMVTDVKPFSQKEGGQVELFMLPDATSPIPEPGQTGQVDIEVEYVSPATLVMRASGQFLDSPRLALSPQKNQE